jgi:hypothetical protein
MMRQVAPYPEALAGAVARLQYRRHLGWQVTLEDDLQRDKPGRHTGESRGLTLTVVRHGPDSYAPYDLERLARQLLTALAEHGGELPGPVTAAAGDLAAALGAALTVHHYFPVPPATFDCATWVRWLFDTLGLVDVHERMEDFTLVDHGDWVDASGEHVTERTTRPFAPVHKPGSNPYTVHEVATWEDVDTDFSGHRVHPGSEGPPAQ